MNEGLTEFIKADGRKSVLIIKENRLLSVGGNEGSKRQTKLNNPRYKQGRTDVAETLSFVSKEFQPKDKDKVLGIIKAYEFLRDRNFPVPETTRYYEKDGRVNLLMSDMTEGGKYKIWGYSNDMSPEQVHELQSMALTDDDLSNIQKMVLSLSNRAVKDQITLFYYYYHVRKNTSTGEIDMVLLDVDQLYNIDATWTDKDSGQRINDNETIQFMKELKKTLSSEG